MWITVFQSFSKSVLAADYNLFVGAVHRYYESRRRVYNDSRPGRREVAEKAIIGAKKKRFRMQVR